MFSFATTQSCMLSRIAFGLNKSRSPTSIQIRIGLGVILRDEMLVKFPCSVRCLRIVRPLLVDERS